MASPTDNTHADGIMAFRSRPDLFRVLCWLASAATVGILAWIIFTILQQALPAIGKFGIGFLTDSTWTPNREKFGVLPFIIGTAASSLIALFFACPLGLAIAIFLSEDFLPSLIRNAVRFVVELLAAIPSVVYGLWGIFVVIPIVRNFGDWAVQVFAGVPILKSLFAPPVYGNSLLAASLVLALMILPTMTAISRGALVAVPKTLREGAYALGATRWETIFGVILPAAAPGVVAAGILALGRAMGETMAVAMLIGNSSRLTTSLLAPSGTLAALLANQFGEARGMQISALMYAALLLVIITLGVNAAGEAVLRFTQKRAAGIH